MPSATRWLSLIRTASDRDARWLRPPPARTAAFSSARSPGSVLRVSRIRTPPPAAWTNARVRVATPDQVTEEVERGALAAQDRPHRPEDPAELVAGRDRVAVLHPPRHGDVRIELPVHLVDRLRPRQHPVLTGDEAAGAEGGLGDDRLRREVAEHAQVLVEGDRDGLAQRTDGGVGVASPRSPAPVRGGARSGAARPRRTRTGRGTRTTARGSRGGCVCHATRCALVRRRRARC